MICRASSRIALTPLPGSRPACADTPRAISSNCPTPLRLVLSAPPGSDGLEHQHRVALRRFRFDQRARGGAADFLVGGPQHDDCAAVEALLDHRARGERGKPDAGLHVEHARPVQAPGLALQRHRGQLTHRPHRVEVAEQQDLPRAVPKRGAQMIAADAVEGHDAEGMRAIAPPSPRAATPARAAPVHGGLVVARRFDRDQRLDEARAASRDSPGSSQRCVMTEPAWP